MAMDREKLLAFFQAHYLSRREVLFKLPLNISIDSFWPELLNRRKAKAQLLPLCNASGMPYWYVLTDRMVAASERLCEEALEQDTSFDPYRTGMTSAMTEEMFFTSFVEGAQIPLQEAMDFLQRGTEPESIQEQMIWNNRHAWSEMIGMLYRPLDEGFVRSMALMLTEEMDDCAEDYRQSDQHPIAAMNNESYEVPPSCTLPDRMREYYDFLQKSDVHPLIKAAVAQAYLLVTRPFPEGNERLSRMMSFAVLLRSGYDFFRDISISSVIARESYHYYKCMCEIIRSENGGDLTYFIEYYLELLVRAIDTWKERLRRREQESLEREREMARHPLKRADGTGPAEGAGIDKPPEDGLWNEVVREETSELSLDEGQTRRKKAITPMPLMTLDKFLEKVDKLKYSPISMNRAIPSKVRMIVDAGLFAFTTRQWSDVTGTEIRQSDYECRFLLEKGWADRVRGGKRFEYTLRIVSGASENGGVKMLVPDEISEETQGGINPFPFDSAPAMEKRDGKIDESPPGEPGFYHTLRLMGQSKSDHVRKTAAIVRDMLVKGITRFSGEDWSNMSGMDMKRRRESCDYMIAHGMIRNLSKRRNQSDYVFLLPEVVSDNEPLYADDVEDDYSPILIARLQKMVTAGNTKRDQRIGSFILTMIDNGIERITTEDWMDEFHVTKSVCITDLRRAVNLGFFRKENPQENNSHYTYVVRKGPYEDVRCSGLTQMQRELLSKLYAGFKNLEFTVKEGARKIRCKESTLDFHLINFAERGIVSIIKHPEYPGHAQAYSFAVTPKDHPTCFQSDPHVRPFYPHSGSSYQPEPVPLAAASG